MKYFKNELSNFAAYGAPYICNIYNLGPFWWRINYTYLLIINELMRTTPYCCILKDLGIFKIEYGIKKPD